MYPKGVVVGVIMDRRGREWSQMWHWKMGGMTRKMRMTLGMMQYVTHSNRCSCQQRQQRMLNGLRLPEERRGRVYPREMG